MGFTDLKTFNLALLAKQGWRLQTNSSSLFHRVYKAKYFPMCDFLEADMGHQPSYAWRSLMAMDGAMVGLGGAMAPLIFFKNIIKYMGTNFSNFVLENYTFVPLKISLILLRVLL